MFSETIAFPEPAEVIVPNIEAGATCWVDQVGMPDPPAGYQWEYWHQGVTGNPATILPRQTVTVSIVNRLGVIGAPGIYIDKWADADESWSDPVVVLTGTTVTYSIVLFNPGGVTLHNVTITDSNVDVADTDCADVPDLQPQ